MTNVTSSATPKTCHLQYYLSFHLSHFLRTIVYRDDVIVDELTKSLIFVLSHAQRFPIPNIQIVPDFFDTTSKHAVKVS